MCGEVQPAVDEGACGSVSTDTSWLGGQPYVVVQVVDAAEHVRPIAVLVFGTCVPGGAEWPLPTLCSPSVFGHIA